MLDVAESYMEVPQLDMEVHESPVKERKPRHPTNTKEVFTNIIKSVDSPMMSSTSAELWTDQSTKRNEDQKRIPGNSKTISLEENNSIPEHQSNYHDGTEAPSEILSSILNQFDEQKEIQMTTGSKESLDKDDETLDVPPPFNWQEELDKMASMDEIKQIAIAEKEMNSTADIEEINFMESSDGRNSLATLEESEAIPVDDLIVPANKKQKCVTSNSEGEQPFKWQEEMSERIKLKGKTYRCVECGFKSQGHMAIIKHLEIHHMKNIVGFKCPDCDSVCDTFLIFNEHMKIVHKVKLSLLQKDREEDKLKEKNSFSFINGSIETASGRPFNWQEEVKKMMRRFCKKLTCSVCQFRINDSLKGQKEMLTHIETDHMENLLGFRCNTCDLLFEHFVSFNQHMHIAHNHSLNLLQNGSLFLK